MYGVTRVLVRVLVRVLRVGGAPTLTLDSYSILVLVALLAPLVR